MASKVVLGPLQPVVLGHAVKESAVLQDEVVDALDVVDMVRVLDDEREELDQLEPRDPGGVRAHLVGEDRVEDGVAVGRVCVLMLKRCSYTLC